MPAWIRVTDKDTGHRSSVPESRLPHGNFTVLKSEATDPLTGDPLPPEYDVAKPAPSTTPTGQQADTTKEKANG